MPLASPRSPPPSPRTPRSSDGVLKGLIDRRQWKAAFVRLHSHPSDASLLISSGGLRPVDLTPLHLACEANAPPSVLQALVVANPDAAKRKGQRGYLPLHYACASPGVTERVASILIAANPDGAATKSDDGSLPLHLACRSGANEAVVDELLASHPGGPYQSDGAGNFPVDHIKNGGAPNKSALFAVLDRAAKYASISKAAAARTKAEYEAILAEERSERAAETSALKIRCESDAAKVERLRERIIEDDAEGWKSRANELETELADAKAEHRKERAEWEVVEEGLRSDLETVQTESMVLSGELEKAREEGTRLRTSEEQLRYRACDLERSLEGSAVLLDEVKEARDESRERVKDLEKQLAASHRRNAEKDERNRKLREALTSLSAAVRELKAEQDETEAGELRALAEARERMGKRVADRAERLDRIGADLEQLLTVDEGEEEDEGTAMTDGSTCMSSLSLDLLGGSPTRHSVEVPILEEKTIGSLILEEVQ